MAEAAIGSDPGVQAAGLARQIETNALIRGLEMSSK